MEKDVVFYFGSLISVLTMSVFVALAKFLVLMHRVFPKQTMTPLLMA